MARVTVERTYLELRSSPSGAEPRPEPDAVVIAEESPCGVATYRHLYAEVGRDYHWRDRLAWSDETVAAHLAREEIRVWVLRDAGGDGGFFELERHLDGSIEISYFGLMASRHGRGLGRMLLTRAISEGWAWGANRLWLHTCTLDGPAALPNYRARGFVPFRREHYEVELPAE